jgi:hypothetical protein
VEEGVDMDNSRGGKRKCLRHHIGKGCANSSGLKTVASKEGRGVKLTNRVLESKSEKKI